VEGCGDHGGCEPGREEPAGRIILGVVRRRPDGGHARHEHDSDEGGEEERAREAGFARELKVCVVGVLRVADLRVRAIGGLKRADTSSEQRIGGGHPLRPAPGARAELRRIGLGARGEEAAKERAPGDDDPNEEKSGRDERNASGRTG
jgi:hypothetical protein